MTKKTTETTLWLIPTPLDLGTDTTTPLDHIIPRETICQASQITHWIVENAKTARAILKRFGDISPLAAPLQNMHITELPREVHKKGDTGFNARSLLQQASQGQYDVGLMSEAGLPAIADPGSSVVRAAHELRMQVRPMVGPSSLLLALMGSGLNGQNFAFTGYLPKAGSEQTKRIKELEKLALQYNQTQLFIETPYRNEALLKTLLQTLQPHTTLSIAFGMTLPQAKHISMKASQWKNSDNKPGLDANIIKLPAIFLLGQ
jgi:Predicted methyltransferases